MRLTVQVLTKLNRSALVHGRISYILPCLGRIEIDQQATGRQAVSVEDLTGCMHSYTPSATPQKYPTTRVFTVLRAGTEDYPLCDAFHGLTRNGMSL